ncbi:TetR/AcrR family transcriptional regulator [Actinomadura xylanilytica]|uniref:TetR/AcrR family transcriptional regulator n=1 Tax=Actinomadura xylanilytica TaxID=887459 RepID=UPI00255B22C1|nr:helix-turn-helix domain-containing protein [Actinomadura xylanilytica]MDL4776449.1 helix-turn-helix domain-containing protein [Actinomadura xylanilytica]
MNGRPPRADALRNRARVLEAAGAVFAERGTAASTEEVARRAGVGIGTVFRHFPTKESLLEAALAGLMEELADRARALEDAADPGAAFFGFFSEVVRRSATKNALSGALAEAGVDALRAGGEAGPALKQSLGTLLERAQGAGAVRADVGAAEVMALLAAMTHAAGLGGGTGALAVVFDGLKAP